MSSSKSYINAKIERDEQSMVIKNLRSNPIHQDFVDAVGESAVSYDINTRMISP